MVGTSHNSKGCIVFGVVLEEMPRQGPCNIRIALIHLSTCKAAEEQEISYLPLRDGQAIVTCGFDDYGDADKFLKCEDGLRFAKAAEFGRWDCPYFV